MPQLDSAEIHRMLEAWKDHLVYLLHLWIVLGLREGTYLGHTADVRTVKVSRNQNMDILKGNFYSTMPLPVHSTCFDHPFSSPYLLDSAVVFKIQLLSIIATLRESSQPCR